MNKINTTHLNATNYWTPLQLDEDENEEEEEEEVNKIYNEQKPKSNKWERRLTRRIEKRMVIDSGETSHFCSEEMDLPKEGESNKLVYLPNGNSIRTTKHPYLSNNSAREQEKHMYSHIYGNH